MYLVREGKCLPYRESPCQKLKPGDGERRRERERKKNRDSETKRQKQRDRKKKSFGERRKYYCKWLLVPETDSESQTPALCFRSCLALTGGLIPVDSILLIRKMWKNIPRVMALNGWLINAKCLKIYLSCYLFCSLFNIFLTGKQGCKSTDSQKVVSTNCSRRVYKPINTNWLDVIGHLHTWR